MSANPSAAPRQLLMTADTIGGVWSYALHLAEGLARSGWSVALATMGAPLHEAQRAAAARIAGLSIYESNYRLEWMDEPWEDLVRAGSWLQQLESTLAPELIHLNSYVHAALPWQAPTVVVGHSCVLSWWQAVRGGIPQGSEAYRRGVACGLRHADMVVTPSQTMLEALRRHYGAFGAGRVIYNGCDHARFRPLAKEPLVLTAGRLWDEGKNVAALERIAASLPWPIYAAGAERHPAGGRIDSGRLCLLGCLDTAALAAWYGRAAIYAQPARYEPFGLSVLEAALAGCALVLGDIPSLREIWGTAALFVPPDDDEALRATILRLIYDQRLRTQLATRARQHARGFTTNRMLTSYLGLYDELLSRRPARQKLRRLVMAGGQTSYEGWVFQGESGSP
jgi:glycogen synthase